MMSLVSVTLTGLTYHAHACQEEAREEGDVTNRNQGYSGNCLLRPELGRSIERNSL